MAFWGGNKKKIMIGDRILKLVSHFNYLGNDSGYDSIYDIDVKSGKFQSIWGTVNRIFRNKVRWDIKLKFYKVMACLLYTSRCV